MLFARQNVLSNSGVSLFYVVKLNFQLDEMVGKGALRQGDHIWA